MNASNLKERKKNTIRTGASQLGDYEGQISLVWTRWT